MDLTQQRFESIVVLQREGTNSIGVAMWLCRCDCGKELVVPEIPLAGNRIKNCGCRECEPDEYFGARRSWRNMTRRCTEPNHHMYKYYGGRGITICARWLESFQNFFDDMGERPKGHQIDRIDSDKGYNPGNCRWVTQEANNRNKRNNRLIEYQGKTQCLADWADELGVDYKKLHRRLRQRNWSMEQALAALPPS